VLFQLGDACGVVAVGVGYPDLGKGYAVRVQVFQHGGGFTRVYADGLVVLLDKPDVVVGVGGDRCNGWGDDEHGGIGMG
jgi:hypothetical protein